jgi:hypothetical protein
MESSDEAHRRLNRVDRRTVLRGTAAVTGAAVVWSAPTVSSLGPAAFAAGSPLCETRLEAEDCTVVYDDTPDCCECVESHAGLPLAEALALCAREGRCVATVDVCGEQEEEPPQPEPEPEPEWEPPAPSEVRRRETGDVPVPTVVEGGK